MTTPFDKPSFVKLPARAVIRVGGADALKFLQGLLTNDLAKLDHAPALHACLLTAQGKFLHDMFVTKDGADYLLECEGGARAADLFKRLGFYKLRSQVTLELRDDVPVYAVYGDISSGYPDPRYADLGYRSFVKPDFEEQPFETWDKCRIALEIADGSRDAELEKSTLEELNMSETAVSFTKGCYVGQELTTRMEMRGLGKKHLKALEFVEIPPFGAEILNETGNVMGEMRSSCGNIGLALVRDDFLGTLRTHHDKHFVRLLGQR